MAARKNPAPDKGGDEAAPADADSATGGMGGFISHLLELRNRLLYAVISVGVVFGGLLPFSNDIYTLLAQPLILQGARMIATDVASPFVTPIKLTLALAVVLSVPLILYQIWAFVAPGLYRHERRMIIPLLLSSTILFYAGMAFAYFVVFPVAFHFFVNTVPHGVEMLTDIKSYLDFVFSMFFAFGIAFELPVALVLLAWMGVVDAEKLATKRPYVILWVFIIAAVLTPPDVFSQIFLAIPMLILFEIGLFFARRLQRLRARDDGSAEPAHKPLSDAEMDAEMDRHLRENPVEGDGRK